MFGKCLGDTFLTFSGHFSSASPSTRTLSRHFPDTFWTFFWEAARKPQKAFWDFFWTFFGNFSFGQLLVVRNITNLANSGPGPRLGLGLGPARPAFIMFLARKGGQNEKLLKNDFKKNIPKCFLGLPGSLPEKCPKSVWKVSWCWGWRWKNVQKMSKKCPPDSFQTLF